jgi:hypothetical protein
MRFDASPHDIAQIFLLCRYTARSAHGLRTNPHLPAGRESTEVASMHR